MEGKQNYLSVPELAELLKVPVSWVYSRTRVKGEYSIPHIRIGKYIRFIEEDIYRWIQSRYHNEN